MEGGDPNGTSVTSAVRFWPQELVCNLDDLRPAFATPRLSRGLLRTTFKEKLTKLDAKAVSDARNVAFQTANAAVPMGWFAVILRMTAEPRPLGLGVKSIVHSNVMGWSQKTPKVHPDDERRLSESLGQKAGSSRPSAIVRSLGAFRDRRAVSPP